MASTLAAETAKLTAVQALAEAREQEHMMAEHAAILLKSEQDKELAKQQAVKVAATTVSGT
jgi:hypothetical protein